jgi:hypothetical protein
VTLGARAGVGACLFALTFLSAPATAQQDTSEVAPGLRRAPPAVPIEGVFLLDSLAGDGVEGIIDRGVGLLPWYKRPFARGRLRETTRPAVWVAIEPGPVALRVRTEVHDLTIPWSGGLQDWEWKAGDPVDVTASWDGADLLQTFQGPYGARYNRYVLSPDGRTLELRVRIESDQLAEPLRYRLVYIRQGDREGVGRQNR